MRLLTLLSLSCAPQHVPSLLDTCPRVEVAAYTAETGCLLLRDQANTLFKLDTSESCGGPPCLLLEPGQTGYALEKVRPGFPATWTVTPGDCEELRCE